MKTAPQRFMRRNVSCTSSSSIAPLSGVRSASFRTGPTARVARAVLTTAAAARGPTVGLAAPPSCSQRRLACATNRSGWRARDHDRADALVGLCARHERGEVGGDLGTELAARPAMKARKKHSSSLLDLDSEAVVLGDRGHAAGPFVERRELAGSNRSTAELTK